MTSATTLEDLPQRLTALTWEHPVYVRGARLPDGPSIAIVGARAASRLAMDRAHVIARHLAGRGVHVVSGGALGVDGAAHRGALAGGGTTTVVLGSGIDVFYPRRHAPLFREVLARGGTVASLLAEGIEPRRSTFVQRNPLIAALADAVIVVEADVRSGSLSTAAAGKRFGRIVAAWPGSRGCERLLARGAAIVENLDDVDRIVAGAPRLPEPIEIADPIAKQIKAAMVGGAYGLDQIVAATGLSVRAVLRALPLLERMK